MNRSKIVVVLVAVLCALPPIPAQAAPTVPDPRPSPAVAGVSSDLVIGGRFGVPAAATAVVLNVTVVAPASRTFVTLWPTGSPKPPTSNVNFAAGDTVASAAVVKLGRDGAVTYAIGDGYGDVLLDVVGFFDGTLGLVTTGASRVYDSRQSQQRFRARESRDVAIGGVGVVPAADVDAVVATVTAASPTATSFLTVYPSGSPRPNASNLNLRGGVDVANVVVMKLGTDGKVRFYNDAGTTDVVVDVVGWFPAASGFSAVAPRRLFDSRQGAPFVAGEKRTVSLGDSKATAAVLNVTAVDGSETSFVTVWPSGPQPTVSSLNPTAGNATANLVVVGLAADGTFQLANAAGRQHLIVDLLGTFVGGTGFHPVTPVRALDTRPTIRSGRDVRHGFPIAASTNVAYAHTHSAYTATDVFAACGTPLLSPVDGVISEVRRIDAYDAEVRNPATLGGRSVAIVGDDGVRYYGSHFDTIDDSTTVGRRVEVGTRIGTMGRTGDTTVCHLHMGLSPACPGPEWSVRRGVIWPWPYLDAWRAGQNMSPQAEIAAWTDANPRGCLDAMRDPNASKASGP